ncbi:MAG: glycine--tRNA ligase subunit beta [Acidobacteria bacterium]|nr:glycine--tRNA ligase subunit beta [Acidobacteriota bacterium]
MSEPRTLLLELHCEEIPARFLRPLTDELEEKLAGFFKAQGLDLPSEDDNESTSFVQGLFSPRKLAWMVLNLPERQPDQTEVQVGPPQRMCVDEAGAPTQTGLKFAEKWGVPYSEVRFELPKGKKEPCAVLTLTRPGRPTVDLLAEALPRLIASLHVPKAMRWGNSDFEFVRPIRNILCLFGETVVPFELDGVKASDSTWGHRLHHREHPEPVLLLRPEYYESALEQAGVVASFDLRRERLAAELERLAAEAGGRVVEDEELLDTLALIVEVPHVVRGAFPESFLSLPKEVLVTSLKEHQKSFCVEDAEGRLLPLFLSAANRRDDPAGFVQAGNEWVLKARLYDARFFFAEDRKAPLESRLEKLKNLTFQQQLGSYFEKTERIMALTGPLAPRLGLEEALAREAARLCKADLRTLMVGEFPELQGIMGGEYLRHEGAPEAVWRAVKEHHRPAGAEDHIPATPLGGLLAAADKLDTVCGCFAVGIIPTGSKDPLALRRAGQGVVRIAWEQAWGISLSDLISAGMAVSASRATGEAAATKEALASFFQDRVAYQLEMAGFAGSVRRSALAVGWSDLVDLRARCEALSAFAEDARFASLAQSAKRIGNILKDEPPGPGLDPSALVAPEELALSARLAHLEATKDHPSLLSDLAELAGPLEAFFTAVMVKCEDAKLRDARLGLLRRLRETFLRVADFSLWQ